MISLLFICLAALLNAFMDTIENERFYSSVFRDWNERFWYKRVSWKYCERIGTYPVDAWHLAKSGMIVCFCFSIVLFTGHLVWFIVYGLAWNLTFNFFYGLFKN